MRKFEKPSLKPNYISGIFQYDTEKVVIWYRDDDGIRFQREYAAPYYFYTADENGDYQTIFGNRVSKVVAGSAAEFDALKGQHKNRYESDFSPLDKILMDEYYDLPAPTPHYSLIDIEADVKMELGFPDPLTNCYAPINAVTVYHQWLDSYICVAVPPNDESRVGFEQKFEQVAKELNLHVKPEIILVDNETELLFTLFDLLEDTDIISGWNSEFFDMPYLVKRTEMVLGKKSMNRWCFKGAGSPKFKEVERFGKVSLAVQLRGRIHLDYLDLFKKFTFEGRTSFKLAVIANEELDIPKIEFDGTLETLYNDNFAYFCCYNIRDVEVLTELDKKYKFIALANQMSHENTVDMGSVLGTVKLSETGITNHAHYYMNKVVNDKSIQPVNEKAEGAIVLSPKIGLHKRLGSVDLKSLYPNTIRTINISNETFIGQFISKEADWHGIFERDDKNHILVLKDGDEITGTGAEWSNLLQQKKWCISGFGTIFDQSFEGIIPSMIGFWYNERKRLQGEKKKWGKKLKELIAAKAPEEEILEAKKQEELYDLLQLTKKISMNSVYGALLNQFFRYFMFEMGSSVTASGRQITTHMITTLEELLSGVRKELVKKTIVNKDGSIVNEYDLSTFSNIIYGDTDSGYFMTGGETDAEAIEIADWVADQTNSTFPDFVRKAFACQPGYDRYIEAAREVVGARGLFQAKKKYMIKVIDLDGNPCNKLKSMGSEIKKSDTPKVIQKFLESVIIKILDGEQYDTLEKYINTERKRLFSALTVSDVLLLGTNKQVNNLDKFYTEWNKLEKPGIKRVNLPGHVRASINYNELTKEYDGAHADQIKSGDKIIIFYLKPNQRGFTSVSFPSDITKFPRWFGNFEVDIGLTQEKMIDNKLEGIFEAWGYEVPTPQRSMVNSVLEF